MPTNEQRREAAKRKLERQLARRAERARRRRQLTIAGSALALVIVVAGGVGIYYLTKGDEQKADAAASTTPNPEEGPKPIALPEPKAKPASVTCKYDVGGAAAKKVNPPQAQVSTTANQRLTLDTSQGAIGVTLDFAHSPCAANSFLSLANQNYFSATSCHRLIAEGKFKILQCGDPTGTGRGGPGYTFADEYPTDQFKPDDPAILEKRPVVYKRGTIAMANSGKSTNGSQFFLVYGDTTLPGGPAYSIFGTIDEPGLAVLEKVGAAGTDPNIVEEDGSRIKPKLPVSITAARRTP